MKKYLKEIMLTAAMGASLLLSSVAPVQAQGLSYDQKIEVCENIGTVAYEIMKLRQDGYRKGTVKQTVALIVLNAGEKHDADEDYLAALLELALVIVDQAYQFSVVHGSMIELIAESYGTMSKNSCISASNGDL